MYIPLRYLVSGLPAIFAGRRIVNVYGIYFRQITSYNMLTLKMPNIYSLLPEQYGMFFSARDYDHNGTDYPYGCICGVL